MLGQPVRQPLVFALLLALFMGWGSHAAAWLNDPPPVLATHGHGHAHGHDEPSGCSLCQLSHGHAHSLGDHIHETPCPAALLRLQAQMEQPPTPTMARRALPQGPIFRIERPPRPSAVL